MTLKAALCAVAAVAIATSAMAEPRPPHLRPDPGTDEGGLWQQTDKAEIQARARADLNKDPALNAYIHGLSCKLAHDYCDEIRFYVMDRPFVNAQMAPNGYGEVWSGLLLRAETEDELAFALGHEISHFAENHSTEAWRHTKNRMNGALVIGLAVAAGGAYAAATAPTYDAARATLDLARSVSDLAYLAAISSIFAYSRANEEEADRLGAERSRATGFNVGASVGLWQDQEGERLASEFPKVRKSESFAGIFNTHPITAARIKALQTYAGGDHPPEGDARRRYRAVIRPHLAAWLRDDLRRRDYGQTLFVLDHLSRVGEDAGLLAYFRGESYRLRRALGDDVLALQAYRQAVAYPDAPADAWRELGTAERRAGGVAEARVAFQTYLDKAPSAQDRWIVEGELKTLAGGAT